MFLFIKFLILLKIRAIIHRILNLIKNYKISFNQNYNKMNHLKNLQEY